MVVARKALSMIWFMTCSMLVASTQHCVNPKEAYSFDKWNSNLRRDLLRYLEEENQPTGAMLICMFGMDVITLKSFLLAMNERLTHELNYIHQGQQHPCWKHGCEQLISIYQQRRNENIYILNVIDDMIDTENLNRSYHLIHELYDMLDILETSQSNALVQIITELEYTRLKQKIENNDLEDMPEVKLLLDKLY